jgi:Uma2 family endonuclease
MKTMPGGLFTRADYELLPEGFPAQLIDGWLIKEPSATYGHQSVASWFHYQLVQRLGYRRVLQAPIDVGIDEHNVYQPDVVVIREIPDDRVHDVGIPLLAVEVLSPSTARRDRKTKCPRLLAAGVAEVWIVDPIAHTVERHDAGGVATASGGEVLRSAAVPGFEVCPATLFERPTSR